MVWVLQPATFTLLAQSHCQQAYLHQLFGNGFSKKAQINLLYATCSATSNWAGVVALKTKKHWSGSVIVGDSSFLFKAREQLLKL